jgi:hypothetical protein
VESTLHERLDSATRLALSMPSLLGASMQQVRLRLRLSLCLWADGMQAQEQVGVPRPSRRQSIFAVPVSRQSSFARPAHSAQQASAALPAASPATGPSRSSDLAHSPLLSGASPQPSAPGSAPASPSSLKRTPVAVGRSNSTRSMR